MPNTERILTKALELPTADRALVAARLLSSLDDDAEADVRTARQERSHIVRDDGILNGEPIIQGTRTPVRAIVEIWRLGVAPEEIPNRLPHLGLAHVFDALSYYSDHQAEINDHIERNRIPDELIDPLVRD